jgi:Fe-S oxidoreductase
MQYVAIVVALGITVVALALVVRAVRGFVRIVGVGQPAPNRGGRVGARIRTMLAESLGHTRMMKWNKVGLAHYPVFIGFGALFFTLLTAYGQLFQADFALPVIGHWTVFNAAMEIIAALTGIGILTLIVIRQANHPRRLARKSRFLGSTWWQAYYVEATIVGIVLCILLLRGLEGALAGVDSWSMNYVVSYPLTQAFGGLSESAASNLVYLIAALKIVISFAWFIVIATHLTMGVAWHRFLAFPNIYLKRNPGLSTLKRNAPQGTSAPSLGPLQPMYSAGKPIDFEDPGDDDIFGVGKVEDFTWKGLLDFTTCTECGRCQSQCPAWNTDKPLSPKLVIMDLRQHLYDKAPFLLAGGENADEAALATVPAAATAEAERPLVGPAELDPVTGHSLSGGVIDPDVLWSCTTCGACVEQCPVDIEHVDHIVDMRRFQVLIESEFPSQLGGLFKNLEGPGNPWGMAQSGRLDWARDLPFEVPVVGVSAEDLSTYDYLFWVGCAGAFEDRAKRTTQAVAELLNTAGVTFAVLGEGETCTGDSARRSGNEFLFQMLAQQNVEVLNEAGATKIVVTCPHCFNTLNREYPQLGGNYEVVHHTQLLNRLVREGRLTPVSRVDEKVTYHDPCYLGRHNNVYEPPRELIAAMPGLTLTDVTRSRERSFCCGAGGARMWMEEKLGTRINMNRAEELVSVQPETVAVGCPFCRVMVSDGVAAIQSDGRAEGVEVRDVAQLLLRAVKGS